MRIRHITVSSAILLAILALAACGPSHTDVHIAGGEIQLHDGYVSIHADDAGQASIAANGDLRIDSRLVAVGAAQRQLLKTYYASAQGIGREGKSVGKAGASMAGHTVGDVLSNLFSGHPERIDHDVKKRTDDLLARVALICDGLKSLRDTQQALAGQLAPFRPYATIKASDVEHCARGVAKGRASLAQAIH